MWLILPLPILLSALSEISLHFCGTIFCGQSASQFERFYVAKASAMDLGRLLKRYKGAGTGEAGGGSCPPSSEPSGAGTIPAPQFSQHKTFRPLSRPLQTDAHTGEWMDIMAFGDSPYSHRKICTSCSS